MTSPTGTPPSRRTIVYVDAFNLYYRRLKRTPYRWLNLDAMCRFLLPSNQIIGIKYYTARITDQSRYARQDTYLRALSTLPTVSITYGHYLSHIVQRRLAHPPVNGPRYVEVIDNEEKGSDVNLATHLVLDACRDTFDVAVVVSNDSDLAEPVRVVALELGKTIGIVSPLNGRAPSNPQLIQHAHFVRRIRDGVLHASQFPRTLTDTGGTFHMPPEWDHP